MSSTVVLSIHIPESSSALILHTHAFPLNPKKIEECSLNLLFNHYSVQGEIKELRFSMCILFATQISSSSLMVVVIAKRSMENPTLCA